MGATRPNAVERVNEVRVAHGLQPLVVSPELTAAAQAHAEDMARQNYFSHDSKDGTLWYERIIRYYPNWRTLGENIAGVYSTKEAAVEGWLASAGHYANIVNPDFQEVGLGHAVGGDYGHYHVMDLGAKRHVSLNRRLTVSDLQTDTEFIEKPPFSLPMPKGRDIQTEVFR